MSSFLVCEFPNGVLYPVVGLGCSKVEESAIGSALHLGFRQLDGAWKYETEDAQGRQVRALGNGPLNDLRTTPAVATKDFRVCDESEFLANFKVPHGEKGVEGRRVFVTTKVWFDHFTDEGIDQTLADHFRDMDRTVADLFLLHWPGPFREGSNPLNPATRLRCWHKLERLYHDGLVRGIGVSNYTPKHLKPLIEDVQKRKAAGDKYATLPMVDQFEMSPYCRPDPELLEICRTNRILPIAYSPLFGRHRGQELREEPVLNKIAEKYKQNVAAIILRWILQQGVAVIPRSNNKERLALNFNCETFELSEADMEEISNGITKRDRNCDDPSLVD